MQASKSLAFLVGIMSAFDFITALTPDNILPEGARALADILLAVSLLLL